MWFSRNQAHYQDFGREVHILTFYMYMVKVKWKRGERGRGVCSHPITTPDNRSANIPPPTPFGERGASLEMTVGQSPVMMTCKISFSSVIPCFWMNAAGEKD